MDLVKEILRESFYLENGRLPNDEELEALYNEFEASYPDKKEEAG